MPLPRPEHKPVTICITTLFRWNYGSNETPLPRVCAIVASDRKITAGDVEYEPAQQKFAQMTPSTILLVSGDISVHSEAIRKTQKQIVNRPDTSPENVALIYAQAMQA